MTILRDSEWALLAQRWTPMRLTPEVMLACATLGAAIHDADHRALDLWARAIDLNPNFVRRQMAIAHNSDAQRK